MLECTYIDRRTEKRIDIEALGKVLIWLSAGALLGLAVALPYDRLLGLPGSTGTVLGAAVWTALLGVLHADRIRGAVEWKEDLGEPNRISCTVGKSQPTSHHELVLTTKHKSAAPARRGLA